MQLGPFLCPQKLRQLSDLGRDLPRLIARVRLRFDLNQALPVQYMITFFLMISFTHQCPRTGQQVQGHVTNVLIEDDGTYELVTCTACGRTHLVNPKTGRLLDQAKK